MPTKRFATHVYLDGILSKSSLSVSLFLSSCADGSTLGWYFNHFNAAEQDVLGGTRALNMNITLETHSISTGLALSMLTASDAQT